MAVCRAFGGGPANETTHSTYIVQMCVFVNYVNREMQVKAIICIFNIQ